LTFLSLQGGGALGAYHVGVVRSMSENLIDIDWVSGVSIGAFTAALIAGNVPEDRVSQLRAFWRAISRPDGWGARLHGHLRRAFNHTSFLTTAVLGQPNFFSPRLRNPYLALPGTPEAMSLYDTRPMLATLERLVDFGRINSATRGVRPRLTLGATLVRTGELVFFDNQEREIKPEHVIASGALPATFPPSFLDGTMYWDGGIAGNTPIDAFTRHSISFNTPKTLLFSVDLYDTDAELPRTMDDVSVRKDAILFGNRTGSTIETLATRITLRRAIADLLHDASPEKQARYRKLAYPGRVDLVQLTYRRTQEDIVHSDGDFSRPTIQAREDQGYQAMNLMLRYRPWEHDFADHEASVFVHRIQDGRVRTDAYVLRDGEVQSHTSYPTPARTTPGQIGRLTHENAL
jgi:NTE family protein